MVGSVGVGDDGDDDGTQEQRFYEAERHVAYHGTWPFGRHACIAYDERAERVGHAAKDRASQGRGQRHAAYGCYEQWHQEWNDDDVVQPKIGREFMKDVKYNWRGGGLSGRTYGYHFCYVAKRASLDGHGSQFFY